MPTCARCGDDRPLDRVYYRLRGESKRRRTKPLCLNCRHETRRLIWRKGGRVLRTEAVTATAR